MNFLIQDVGSNENNFVIGITPVVFLSLPFSVKKDKYTFSVKDLILISISHILSDTDILSLFFFLSLKKSYFVCATLMRI